jgi:hypothetical protein
MTRGRPFVPRPVLSISSSGWFTSHPRLRITYAPTLGWSTMPAIVRCSTSTSLDPWWAPQPPLVGNPITPSTFGNRCRASLWNRKWSTIVRVAELEQLTEARIAT